MNLSSEGRGNTHDKYILPVSIIFMLITSEQEMSLSVSITIMLVTITQEMIPIKGINIISIVAVIITS